MKFVFLQWHVGQMADGSFVEFQYQGMEKGRAVGMSPEGRKIDLTPVVKLIR
jgi:hypothetical protein